MPNDDVSVDQMDELPKCSHDSDSKPQKEQTVAQNEQSSTQKDHPETAKDHSAPAKDISAPTTNLSPLTKDLSAPTKDLTTPTKDKSKTEASTNEQPASLRYQAATSIEITPGRRSPRNVESGLSFFVARVESTTLSYQIKRNSCVPLIIRPSTQSPITSQPRMSPLISPASVAVRSQPQSLFIQALTKLNESSLTLSVINHLRLLQSNPNLRNVVNFDLKSGDITPPDSLTSAPPSYSFVLRQMAVRRRPRIMGAFLPSPSFVQHTPPPTYTTAFDVYIEPALPPPPARVYTFGFASMPIVCPECGYTGMTMVTTRVTICTHLCAFILCLLCCWLCAPLPYVLSSCKDVYHYCRNCRSFLGMYCPTNPDNSYP